MTYWQSLSAAHSPIAWWCNIGKVQQQPKPQQQHGMSPWNKRNKTFFLTTLISERPLSALCQTTKSMTIQQQQQQASKQKRQQRGRISIQHPEAVSSRQLRNVYLFPNSDREKNLRTKRRTKGSKCHSINDGPKHTHTHRMNRHQQPLSKQKLRTPNVIGAQA